MTTEEAVKGIILHLISAIVFFGAWPYVAKYGNVPANWMTILYAIGAIPVGVASVYEFGGTTTTPNLRILGWGLLAGAINGIGARSYSSLAVSTYVDTSTLLAIVAALVPCVQMAIGILFFGEPATPNKLIGLVAICFGIYVLVK